MEPLLPLIQDADLLGGVELAFDQAQVAHGLVVQVFGQLVVDVSPLDRASVLTLGFEEVLHVQQQPVGVPVVREYLFGTVDDCQPVLHENAFEPENRLITPFGEMSLDQPVAFATSCGREAATSGCTEREAAADREVAEPEFQLIHETTDGVADSTPVCHVRTGVEDGDDRRDEHECFEAEVQHALRALDAHPRDEREKRRCHDRRDDDVAADERHEKTVVLRLLEDHLVVLFGFEVRHAHTPFIVEPRRATGRHAGKCKSIILYHTYAYFAILLCLSRKIQKATIAPIATHPHYRRESSMPFKKRGITMLQDWEPDDCFDEATDRLLVTTSRGDTFVAAIGPEADDGRTKVVDKQFMTNELLDLPRQLMLARHTELEWDAATFPWEVFLYDGNMTSCGPFLVGEAAAAGWTRPIFSEVTIEYIEPIKVSEINPKRLARSIRGLVFGEFTFNEGYVFDQVFLRE